MQQLEQVTIGHYQILNRLARGGMAEIYLAQDTSNDQIVAVKLVNTGAGDYYERFKAEVKAQAALNHEHILPVLDYGEFDSWCYLITPYIEDGTLHERLSQGPLSLVEADRVLSQLSQALQYAHDKGIVHRDIKPSNVLMRDGTHAYLADFGLVKRVGDDNGLTLTGYLIGTPEYMAPELAENEAAPSSDVYALGILMYQLLCGRVPFTANTPIGIYLCHIRDIPTPPSTYNPAIPAPVEAVIMRALEKNPRRRFQSAQELYQAFTLAMGQSEQLRHDIGIMSTQVSQFVLEKPRIAIVRQKHSTLRGRFLFTLLLVPFLLVMLPAMLHASVSIAGTKVGIEGASAASSHPQPLISTPATSKNTIHIKVTPTKVPTPKVVHNVQPKPAPQIKPVVPHNTRPVVSSHAPKPPAPKDPKPKGGKEKKN
ncbi:hypothetical protein KDW_21840 [Dictyobacter vulcani]|uniref:non-specific serine/threonine protein kinase n=1 Tax=Dictyobacter vulcani TaxID=2607529 RepID=A0A5J4KLQ0_9CHLR|nr:serine/threonine-protein kinase [Dictyobacter vulcani]GER88022.1 hypothetical protein KDW_21840 [Dictyobacter vulcani]